MTGAGGLRRRLVLLTGGVAAAVAVVLVVISHLVIDRANLAVVTQVLEDRAATIATATGEGADPAPGPGAVVYDEDGAPVAGAVPPGLETAFAEASTASSGTVTHSGETALLFTTTVDLPDATRRVIVVSEALEAHESAENTALLLAAGAGIVMVALAMGVAAVISRRALTPVRRMAEAAREWSRHDLDHRFDLGPPDDEIHALGQVLDELLERVAAALRAEQLLSAEMAHELRTPLTTLRGTAGLLARRDDLDDEARTDVATVLASCDQMADTIRVLLEEARSADVARHGCRGPELAHRLRSVHGGAVALDLDLPDGIAFEASLDGVHRTVAPLLDNAARLATAVTVRARQDGATIELVVADDGPGVEEPDGLFRPDGGGLGLALARRLAERQGGSVALRDGRGERGGATFVVRLPAATP